MAEIWFIAVEKFSPETSVGWADYLRWSTLFHLKELVPLDNMLCPPIIKQLTDKDWLHNIHEDFRILFFHDLNYLISRVRNYSDYNLLAVMAEPSSDAHQYLSDERFSFYGYDLIEEGSGISSLSNCGGFEKAFDNNELSEFGLIVGYERAKTIQEQLLTSYPDEIHAFCDLWAIWRMDH